MRRRLDGGKFRMLNEQLYTTTGDDAFDTFQAEPELFDVVLSSRHTRRSLFSPSR
jgi:ribosomal RNA-processing protein 8